MPAPGADASRGPGSVRGPGRPRSGSEDKRDRILREAAAAFARRGFSGTSLTDIAAAANISKAGLLHHFSSKDSLVSAVLKRRDAAETEAMTAQPATLWECLDGWVALMERNSATPGMVGLYTAMTSSGIDYGNPVHPWLHEHFVLSVRDLQEWFERAKDEGDVLPDTPSCELARAIVALSDGIQAQWLCARADAAATGRPGHGGQAPDHDGHPVDMAAQMRTLVTMIKQCWAA